MVTEYRKKTFSIIRLLIRLPVCGAAAATAGRQRQFRSTQERILDQSFRYGIIGLQTGVSFNHIEPPKAAAATE